MKSLLVRALRYAAFSAFKIGSCQRYNDLEITALLFFGIWVVPAYKVLPPAKYLPPAHRLSEDITPYPRYSSQQPRFSNSNDLTIAF
jgi:hypothetical protein